MTFDADAVNTLQAAIVTQASKLTVFARVFAHEPRSAPGVQMSCAIWLGPIRPVTSSGLDSTSGVVTFQARVYKSMLGANAKEDDKIDPAVLTASSLLIGAFTAAFTLSETVRAIDLLGMHGPALSAEPGYLLHEDKPFRVVELTIPVIMNDLWDQEA